MAKPVLSETQVTRRSHRTNGNSRNHFGHTTCISWPSIFAGLAVSVLTYLTLMVLGAAIGGFALSDLEGFVAFSWSAVVWTILTGIVSLFAGAYAASRISNYISSQVGAVQALTISSFFFGFMIWSGGALVGSVGAAIPGAASTAMGNMSGSDQIVKNIMQNEEVIEFTRQGLQDLGINPQEVDQLAMGVISRLSSGQTESAKNYIASQTNIDPSVVESRLNRLEKTVTANVEEAASRAASIFSAASWFVFFMITLSTVSAIVGGVMGAKRNAKDSLERIEMLDSNYAA